MYFGNKGVEKMMEGSEWSTISIVFERSVWSKLFIFFERSDRSKIKKIERKKQVSLLFFQCYWTKHAFIHFAVAKNKTRHRLG